MTAARMIWTNKVSETLTLNICLMEEKGVAPADLFTKYMLRFDMAHIMSLEDNPDIHKITDFFSFYDLPSTIIRSHNPNYGTLEAGYYATDVTFEDSAEEDGRLKQRLQTLIGGALIIANQAKLEVFNTLRLMENVPILLEDLKLQLGRGSGLLSFYLYNWRTTKLARMEDEGGTKAGRGLGVVMLHRGQRPCIDLCPQCYMRSDAGSGSQGQTISVVRVKSKSEFCSVIWPNLSTMA
ncbi:acyl-CoA N-acyltransferase [Mycena alexandri]|uniref:Glycylpeptide N-tetradecanoyltransferase n=1 Tax=Mycena alexandri TaxID=1745969 RepID=A0AAD6TMH3_9AGAR|nr:acyl-CoA N-acyltransferase [Mycena alexandri]